jgi:hypothetical protein
VLTVFQAQGAARLRASSYKLLLTLLETLQAWNRCHLTCGTVRYL